MKIGIEFSDNDFHATFMGVLAALNNVHDYYSGEWNIDKDQLAKIINELSYGCYLAFQPGIEQESNSKYLREYLKIKSSNIYFNEEIDDYINKYDNCLNHEFYVLDTDLNYPGNYPIYSI